MAKHCLLDWLGVSLAGSSEPLCVILRRELAGSGPPEATVIGCPGRGSAHMAALINGAAAHALDYDDMHLTMMGHPTAPVASAVMALAERRGSSGAELVSAFVAGVEVECRLGALVSPSHYARGWHATSTLGTFGAAAACAHLLALQEREWLHALGIAGSQAAGLKGVFGTMSKPLQVGRAAANGLLSAALAASGFTGTPDIVEVHQGFGSTHAEDLAKPDELEGLNDRHLILDTLFKFHAACYLTHSVIEGAAALRRECGVRPEEVAAVELEVNPDVLDVANIVEPRTGLEGKFSLRVATAMALLGHDTADPASYSDARVTAPDVQAMRDRVTVSTGDIGVAAGTVRLRTTDGRQMIKSADTGVPAADLGAQAERLKAKFELLAGPVIGQTRVREILEMVQRLEGLAEVGELMSLCRV